MRTPTLNLLVPVPSIWSLNFGIKEEVRKGELGDEKGKRNKEHGINRSDQERMERFTRKKRMGKER